MKPIQTTNEAGFTRRSFLKVAGALGLSAAGMTLLEACGVQPATSIPEGAPLETTTLHLIRTPSICIVPLYLAEEFLKMEGFTDVQYIDVPSGNSVGVMAAGQVDMAMQFSGPFITYVDAGEPIKVLAGVHVGCFVLFGNDQVKTISDLKGKMVSIAALGGPEHAFISSILTYVGLDPNTDINWTILPGPEAKQQFTDGKIDALLAFPPAAQELEDNKIGHMVLNSMTDAPWSQYYCCMVTGRSDFVQQNPVATKRALRAILKATDICARDPERAAKFIVDNGFTQNYEYALQAFRHIPYDVWRDFEPEDTIRFYALQLHEAGLIKSNPEGIIAKGTDWTFLNELKAELKADNPLLPEHQHHSDHG